MDIYQLLHKLEIPYEEIEHPAVFTSAQALQYADRMPPDAIGCRNLFLTDTHKKQYILAFIDRKQKADLKAIARIMGTTRLHFASPEELQEILGIFPGCVSPLALVNDKSGRVRVYLDPSLKGKKVLLHPVGTNTRTLAMKCSDLEKFLAWVKSRRERAVEERTSL